MENLLFFGFYWRKPTVLVPPSRSPDSEPPNPRTFLTSPDARYPSLRPGVPHGWRLLRGLAANPRTKGFVHGTAAHYEFVSGKVCAMFLGSFSFCKKGSPRSDVSSTPPPINRCTPSDRTLFFLDRMSQLVAPFPETEHPFGALPQPSYGVLAATPSNGTACVGIQSAAWLCVPSLYFAFGQRNSVCIVVGAKVVFFFCYRSANLHSHSRPHKFNYQIIIF